MAAQLLVATIRTDMEHLSRKAATVVAEAAVAELVHTADRRACLVMHGPDTLQLRTMLVSHTRNSTHRQLGHTLARSIRIRRCHWGGEKSALNGMTVGGCLISSRSSPHLSCVAKSQRHDEYAKITRRGELVPPNR